MPDSIEFCKGIFLHVIPVRIIVPWPNIDEDENTLDTFKYAANETTLIDTSHDNEFFQ